MPTTDPATGEVMTDALADGPQPKPERCPSCNAIIDPFNGACRCFD